MPTYRVVQQRLAAEATGDVAGAQLAQAADRGRDGGWILVR
jgi:hypothetical protein